MANVLGAHPSHFYRICLQKIHAYKSRIWGVQIARPIGANIGIRLSEASPTDPRKRPPLGAGIHAAELG